MQILQAGRCGIVTSPRRPRHPGAGRARQAPGKDRNRRVPAVPHCCFVPNPANEPANLSEESKP
jgi:hypothetical protein